MAKNNDDRLLVILNYPEVAAALVEFLDDLTSTKKDQAIEAALAAVFDENKRMEAARLIGRREAYRELRNLFDHVRKVAKQ